jgi:hypothetical protein
MQRGDEEKDRRCDRRHVERDSESKRWLIDLDYMNEKIDLISTQPRPFLSM